MSYHANGRYKHSTLTRGDSGRTNGIVYSNNRARLSYAPGTGETPHVVEVGDTLTNLAARYFGDIGFPTPAMLYWMIADFQPDPILDPTIELAPNKIIYIPTPAYIQSWLMSETNLAPHTTA